MKFVDAAEVGMSTTRLQELAKIVQGWVGDGHMHGASYVIARHGSIVAQEAFGTAQTEPEPAPVTRHTIFGILSLTKIVMGTAVMLLLDRGQLLLDDSIAELLPECSGGGKGSITVEQLLTHSSGLGFTPDLYVILDLMAKEASEEDWKQAARQALPTFRPGTTVEYSPQFGPSILKWMAEKITGMEIEEFCQANIFRPLGMGNASWRPPRDVWPRIAHLFDPVGLPYPRSLVNSEYARTRLNAVWGGLYTTPYDIARLLQTYLNCGELDGHRLLSRAMVRLGTTVHTTSLALTPLAPGDMGFLFVIKGERRGFAANRLGDLASPSAFGFGGGDTTWAWADPERRLLAVFFCNTVGTSDPIRAAQRSRHMRIFNNYVVASVLED